ncbi:STM4012 family radical SAM protein [Alienimonas californiensis]|uniref:Oxygen-independent coproporphyrinogen-III oxidase 1 n=1 Tax=Alienimonas californiensis TaxID=2527989 RepID=A0A517P4E4_9PLAN|nr:STM4012 family radical SAM protein [Alienimonas californiensis]QDT14231.1 Oxygen-independent coproporphyrinogen-III oxidase 1 [Alienimonas californiensis]
MTQSPPNEPDSPHPLDAANPFVGYAYSYPHKSAYRTLNPPVPLAEAWAGERRDGLFLYAHLPFCEVRCGFCNLFTLANSGADLVAPYLRALRAEAAAVREALPDARFARVALGGGTPTYLDERELAELLELLSGVLGTDAGALPASCEASPATLTAEKANLLRAWGVDRLSLGVQSFDEAEAKRLGRPQRTAEVRRAIEHVRDAGFPVLNLDLIYGTPGQSLASWLRSVGQAIETGAEEIYLYPLYVRELTGLGRTHVEPNDGRLDAYRAARERLLGEGYEQHSLRMFAKRAADGADVGPAYDCQSDGMVGLGCGARSYAGALHYSTEYAVGRAGVRAILTDYVHRDPADFAAARHGHRLAPDDRRRRFVLQGLLQSGGLDAAAYRRRFHSEPLADLPQLVELTDRGLAAWDGDRLKPTAAGLERSDAIGPWLYSPQVNELMAGGPVR